MTAEDGKYQQWILPNSEVYHQERYGPGETFKYQIPTEGDGEYTLILKFSEIYFTAPGDKVFDVKIGSKFIAKKLDIFGSLLSKMLPYDIFVSIMVKGGKLYVEV